MNVTASKAPTAPALIPAEGYVRIRQLLSILSVSRATIIRWVKDGTMPAPVKIGRSVFFRVDDIRVFIASHGITPADAKR